MENKILRDDYYIITVKWMGGFTHKVPCRGYNLKSLLRFHETFEYAMYAEAYSYEQTTKQQYDKLIYGDEEWEQSPVADTELTKKKISSTPSPKRTTRKTKEHSPTKSSVKVAKKNTKTTAISSTTRTKRTTG